MNPSKRWFPTTFPERVAWYRNFSRHFVNIGPSLGFSPAEIAQIEADHEMMEFLAVGVLQYERFMTALREFRKTVTENREGSTQAFFPLIPSATPPAGFSTGLYDRLIRTVTRIRAAPGFTDETAALLGLRPSYSSRETELQEAPTIKASAMPRSRVLVKFFRGAADGIDIEAQLDGSREWHHVGRFLVSPAEFAVQPSEAGTPRVVRLRARYIKGNTARGDFSTTASVVTAP